ncbi:hypothetical protein [Xylella fastidiosa]|nr:hypothetical protein [Xylella fastidiosa]MDD0868711.1 hypothetical protein [Xylella fastidiosa subsp. multiplex]MDD0886206.1 hypothetical protein [Xylella fastidiosa subsp. multiplex]MDD0892798.1 hypothetical protein [Xylella fastidiosa subsp. multiplex]MDD0908094.1 hypothetical protein [Xylella fastidiosa subsp. multiplex]MDD0939246.1 hypothetical protein [Xylella fastidiosa subsp. multiplex]
MAAPPAWRWSSASTGTLSTLINETFCAAIPINETLSLDIAVIDELAVSFTVKVQRQKAQFPLRNFSFPSKIP